MARHRHGCNIMKADTRGKNLFLNTVLCMREGRFPLWFLRACSQQSGPAGDVAPCQGADPEHRQMNWGGGGGGSSSGPARDVVGNKEMSKPLLN